MSSKRPGFQRASSTKVLELFDDTPAPLRSPIPTSRGDASSNGLMDKFDAGRSPLSSSQGPAPAPIPPPQPPMSTPPSGRSSYRKRHEKEKSTRRMPAGQSIEYKTSSHSPPGTPGKSPRKSSSRSSRHLSPVGSLASTSDHKEVKSSGTMRRAQSERNLSIKAVESSQVREGLGTMTLKDHQEYIERMMKNVGDGNALDEVDGHDSWAADGWVPPASKSFKEPGKDYKSYRKDEKITFTSPRQISSVEEMRISPKKSSKTSDFVSKPKSERNLISGPIPSISFQPEIVDDRHGGRPPSRASKSISKAKSERNLLSMSEHDFDRDERGQSRYSMSSTREVSKVRSERQALSASEHSNRDRRGQSRSSLSSGREQEPYNEKVKSDRRMLSSSSEHSDRYRTEKNTPPSTSRRESSKSPQRRRSSSKDARRTRSVSRDGRRRHKSSESVSTQESEYDGTRGYQKDADVPQSRERRSSSKDAKRTRSVSRDRRRRDADGGRRSYKSSESLSTEGSEYDDRYQRDVDVRKSRERRESSKSPESPRRRSSPKDTQRSRSVSRDRRRRDADGGRRSYKTSESMSTKESENDDRYERDADETKSRDRRRSSKSPESPRRRSGSKDAKRSRSTSRDGRRRDADGGRRSYDDRYQREADVPKSEMRRMLKKESNASKSPASSGGSRSRSLSVARGRRSSSRDGRRRDPDGERGRGDSSKLEEEQQLDSAYRTGEKYATRSEGTLSPRRPSDSKSPASLRGSKSPMRSPKRHSAPRTPTSLHGSKSPLPRRSGSKSPAPGRRRSRSMSRSRQKDSKSSSRVVASNIPDLSSTSLSSKESPKQSSKRASSVDAKVRRSFRRASRDMPASSAHSDGGGRRARASRKSSSGNDSKDDSKGWKSLQKKMASSTKDEQSSVQSLVSPGSNKPRRGRKTELLSNSDNSLGVESKNQNESESDRGKEKTKDAGKTRSKSQERKVRSKSSERRKSSDDGSVGAGVSRRRKREMDRSANVIQRWTRRKLENLAIQRRLLDVQTTSRRFREADFTFRMEHDKKFQLEAPISALRIERMIRGHQGKTALERLKDEKQRRLETASIAIQTTMRVYLAKLTRERAKWRKEYEWQRDYEKYKPEMAKYLEYIEIQRLVQHTSAQELEVVNAQLAKVEEEFEKEREKMTETMEIQKKIWGDVIRKRVEQEQAKKALEEKKQAEEGADLGLDPNTTPEEHRAEMEEENALMKDWIEKTRAKIKSKEDEGKELEKANADVETMFHELNDFAKKKVAEKKDLNGQQLMLSKMLIPKAVKSSEKATEEAKIEARSKLMHRRSIYKVLEGVQSSDAYDHELYEEIKNAIKECEQELSNELLEGDKMRELLIGDIEALFEIELAGLHELGDIPSGGAPDAGWNKLAKGVLANVGAKKKEKLTWDLLDKSIHD